MVWYWVSFGCGHNVKTNHWKPLASHTNHYIVEFDSWNLSLYLICKWNNLSSTRTISEYFLFQAGCMISLAATTCRSTSPECSSPSRERCWWCCHSSRRYKTCARRRSRRASSNCRPWTTSNRSAKLYSVYDSAEIRKPRESMRQDKQTSSRLLSDNRSIVGLVGQTAHRFPQE